MKFAMGKKNFYVTINILRLTITCVALIGIALHMLFPCLKIDSITLGLLIIAMIPWLTPILKSVELPGGFKVELRDIGERAKNAGMLSTSSSDSKQHDFSFQLVAENDPNLALAGLRIEIEKRLIQLAEANSIKASNKGLGYLLRELAHHSLLSIEERSILADLTSQLNSAVHGAIVTKDASDWALNVGPKLLEALDERISKK